MKDTILKSAPHYDTPTILGEKAIELLKAIIAIPSFSGEERCAADYLETLLQESHNIRTIRKFDNIWCYNKYFDLKKPTVLLTSNIDTAKPHDNWSLNPFEARIQDGKLFGLGSNDSGASVVSLISTFLYFYDWKGLPFNLCLAISAQEQNSGVHGLKSIISDLMPISFAIVGAPTNMQMAMEEMNSLVLDCTATGITGHSNESTGDNAIYRAMRDINWFQSYKFKMDEDDHHPMKMTVTEINAGTRHNIIPDICFFTVDIRFNKQYCEKEVMNVVRNHTFCDIKMRTNLVTPSAVDLNHPLVRAGRQIGSETYFSPSTSERSLLNVPSITMGPGSPLRSLMEDEYVCLSEVLDGTAVFIKLLKSLSKIMNHPDAAAVAKSSPEPDLEIIFNRH